MAPSTTGSSVSQKDFLPLSQKPINSWWSPTSSRSSILHVSATSTQPGAVCHSICVWTQSPRRCATAQGGALHAWLILRNRKQGTALEMFASVKMIDLLPSLQGGIEFAALWFSEPIRGVSLVPCLLNKRPTRRCRENRLYGLFNLLPTWSKGHTGGRPKRILSEDFDLRWDAWLFSFPNYEQIWQAGGRGSR